MAINKMQFVQVVLQPHVTFSRNGPYNNHCFVALEYLEFLEIPSYYCYVNNVVI